MHSAARLAAAAGALLAGGCAGLGGGDEDPEAAASTAPAPTVEIAIEGVEADVAENVRRQLRLAREPCDAPEWRVRGALERSERDVEAALRALGYYAPAIERRLERTGACWRAIVTIAPGEPVVVREVDLAITGEASDDPAFDSLRGALPIAAGDRAHHGRYEQAKRAVASLAAERGYFDARWVRSALRVDPDAHRAEVILHYDSGPRHRFGELRLDQDALDAGLVRRITRYERGEPYSAGALTRMSRSLSDSGYYARVDVRPRPEAAGEDAEVPVDASLGARDRHSFTAGVGLTTDTGPRVRLGYQNRRVNRRGHRWSVRGAASLVEREATAEYRIPLEDPRSEWLSLRTGWQQTDTDSTESEVFKLGARQTKRRPWGWLETRSLDLSREDFTVGRTSGLATLLVPGLSWANSTSDDERRPSRGWRAFAEVRGAHETLVSDTTFLRFNVSGTWLRALPWGARVILRGEAGALTVDGFDALPPSQRFFAGGDRSVRGYGYQELGPRDASGEVIGGEYLLVGSVEYEHPVHANWSVAAFLDAGNAFGGSGESEGFARGVGAGVRWHSPIGPVRVDLAHPLDGDQIVRLHLRIGPEF